MNEYDEEFENWLEDSEAEYWANAQREAEAILSGAIPSSPETFALVKNWYGTTGIHLQGSDARGPAGCVEQGRRGVVEAV